MEVEPYGPRHTYSSIVGDLSSNSTQDVTNSSKPEVTIPSKAVTMGSIPNSYSTYSENKYLAIYYTKALKLLSDDDALSKQIVQEGGSLFNRQESAKNAGLGSLYKV